MKLQSVKYSETDLHGNAWSIDGLALGDTNLIVGKNSTGKTRALNLIVALADLLSGRRNPVFLSMCAWDAKFKDGDTDIQFEIRANEKVRSESLTVGGQKVLSRVTDGPCYIKAVQLQKDIEFQTPDDKLACVMRRDSVQHPFLEPLYTWGTSLRHYLFGTPLGKNAFGIKVDGAIEVDFRATDNVIGIFSRGVSLFGPNFVEAVKADLAQIGYDISDIDIGQVESMRFLPEEVNDSVKALRVREAGAGWFVDQGALSQGMFRALSLLVQLNYARMANAAQCVVIDDIGEGLDYERSKALIQVVVSKAATSGVQLIMSTNDRFVMNSVPLDMWSVMARRPGGNVQVYNYQNARDRFEEFQFTGLNNFDFFAMDFATKGP
jgi:hypothetical protein